MSQRVRVRVRLRDRRGRTLATLTTRPLSIKEARRVHAYLLPRLIADLAASLAPRRK